MVTACKVKCNTVIPNLQFQLNSRLKRRTSKLLGYIFSSGLKEAHESNDATHVMLIIDVEVHDYPSSLSQSEDIDLYWHFGTRFPTLDKMASHYYLSIPSISPGAIIFRVSKAKFQSYTYRVSEAKFQSFIYRVSEAKFQSFIYSFKSQVSEFIYRVSKAKFQSYIYRVSKAKFQSFIYSFKSQVSEFIYRVSKAKFQSFIYSVSYAKFQSFIYRVSKAKFQSFIY